MLGKQRSIYLLNLIFILVFSLNISMAMDVPIFNMMPPEGSEVELRIRDTFVVSVDFYLEGVTTESGGNTEVECILWWDGANGVQDATWDAEPMTEVEDAPDGESDRHTIRLDTTGLPADRYGYTTRCDYDDQRYWFGDNHPVADGFVILSEAVAPDSPISNMIPADGSQVYRLPGDTELLTVTVDFYLEGVTDSEGAAEGVTCLVWTDLSDGSANFSWGAVPMAYEMDANGGLVDRHRVDIDISELSENSYGFTSRCDYDEQRYWFNEQNPTLNGDGTLIITSELPEEETDNPDSVDGVDWVGTLSPRGGIANIFMQDETATLDYSLQVYEEAVTESEGEGAGIDCFLTWQLFDSEEINEIAMRYSADVNNNDEYVASVDISALDTGNYAVDTYCKLSDEDTVTWRSDNLERPIDEGASIISIVPAPTVEEGNAFVHLFEWKWKDISAECPFLAEAGYTAVQISPPQEHVVLNDVDSDPWWTRYQPVSYILESRSGTEAEFKAMVENCNAVGVGIYVDAVINHMSGVSTPTQPGTAGTVYEHYEYPGLYTEENFNFCEIGGGDISNYQRRFEVQNCELLNLADLATGTEEVRTQIRAYLQGLIDSGVAGFRIDASKHMPAHDITAILDGLEGDVYIFQEVIGSSNEPITAMEYILNGDVTEFGYTARIGDAFNCGILSSLESISDGLLPSDDAVVFVDNHDNQRGHGGGGDCILDHRDAEYSLGNIFMLAYPYGYPKVMSSYYWDDGSSNASDNPPPTASVYTDGEVTGCNGIDWVCEHRRPEITAMVNFRQVTAGEPVVNLESIDRNQIAFGRGESAYVAINNEDSDLSGHTFQTAMPAGEYCDVISGGLLADASGCAGLVIVVNDDGQITDASLPAHSAFAIHVEAKLS